MTVLTHRPQALPTLAGGGWELFTVCTPRGYLGVRRGRDEEVAVESLGDLCPDGVAPTSGTSTVQLGHDGQVTVLAPVGPARPVVRSCRGAAGARAAVVPRGDVARRR